MNSCMNDVDHDTFHLQDRGLTPSETESPHVSCGSQTPVRAGPARVKDAGPAPGPLGPLPGAKVALRVYSWLRGSFLAGRRMSASRVKGNRKIAHPVLTCPPGSMGSVSRRMFCSKKKKSSACLPYFFASLKALSKGHIDSHRALHLHSVQASLGKKHALRTRVWHRWCAVGRHFVTLPVLGFQAQLHQPPAQEIKLISQLNRT